MNQSLTRKAEFFIVQFNNQEVFLDRIETSPAYVAVTANRAGARRFPNPEAAVDYLTAYLPPENNESFQIVRGYEKVVFESAGKDFTKEVSTRRGRVQKAKERYDTLNERLDRFKQKWKKRKGGRIMGGEKL